MAKEKTAADETAEQPAFYLFEITVKKTVEKTFTLAMQDEGTGEIFYPDDGDVERAIAAGELNFGDCEDDARYALTKARPINTGGIINRDSGGQRHG